jgi:hypothetical protein
VANYLPFGTMSGKGEPLRIWIDDFRLRRTTPGTLPDSVFCGLEAVQKGQQSVARRLRRRDEQGRRGKSRERQPNSPVRCHFKLEPVG